MIDHDPLLYDDHDPPLSGHFPAGNNRMRTAMSNADVSSDLNDLRRLVEAVAGHASRLQGQIDRLEARIHTLETGEVLPTSPPQGEKIAAALRACDRR